MRYKKEILGNFIDVESGYAFKSKDFTSSGIPVIKIKNIKPPFVSLDDVDYVPQDFESEYERFRINYNDILIAMTGSHINQWESVVGRVARVKFDKSTLLNQRVGRIVLKENCNADIGYIYYFLSQDKIKIELSSKAGGAANQANINSSHIKQLELPIPCVEVQSKIASILSAYDDLIENNQKQIKLLEEAAQRLYKEWFVDLRFPGHENVKIVDGVPEGWKKGHINELIAYDIGGGWGEESSSSECQVPAFVIRGTDFDSLAKGDMENIPFRYHKESNYCKRKLEEGDIVFEVSGGSKNEGVARTIFVTESLLNGLKNSVICASFCKLVRPKKGFSKYLYDSFRYMRSCHITEQYDKRSASSIVNFRWQEFLVQEMVLIPSHNVLNQYNDLSLNINKIIERRVETCNLAKAARDRLLPKLMSGEIEV